MRTEDIEWYKPTEFYILVVSSYVKIGISSNWEKRKKLYEREFIDIEFQKLKSIQFEFRWQAELLEQVVKWRLRRWVVPGRHEYFNLQIQTVLDCFYQTKNELEPEFIKHSHIHKKGKNRWDFYRQIAEAYFKY
ncbi:MAG: hypothetical protein HWD85_09155 [Flavobacteriaceae bacterium]|nr:hypothetical protein [Flavobacteriaceae bacterium]